MDQTQLIITLMADGSINVNGPIKNKHLCYGLLECAKDAIREFGAKNKDSDIVVPFPNLKVQHDA